MAAADFIMPRLPDPSQNHYFRKASQPIRNAPTFQSQYSPQISPSSQMKRNSPPGTHNSGFTQRQPRALFMPAVLRPNEFPSKEPRPHVETAEDVARSPSSVTTCRPSPGLLNLAGLGSMGMARLTRRSTGDSGKVVEPDLNTNLFAQVSAPPTRQHWKDDEKAAMCEDPSCTRQFGYFTRRHHCRRCGNIFCDSHSSAQIPLDAEAQYNPRGMLSRACDFCNSEFRLWWERTSSMASSETSSTTRPMSGTSATSAATNMSGWAGISTAPTSPTALASPVPSAISLGSPHESNQNTPQQPEVAQSVPRDWNWSTF